MARRVSLDLTITQARFLREDAARHVDEAADGATEQRWRAIVREADRAIDSYDARESRASAKPRD